MGHQLSEKPFVLASLTPLFYDFLLDILLTLSVVLVRCNNHRYFYQDTISRKVTNLGQKCQPEHVT